MGEIHLDLFNLNSIVVILLIILIGGYLYYEIYKLKSEISGIKHELTVSSQEGDSYEYQHRDIEQPYQHDQPGPEQPGPGQPRAEQPGPEQPEKDIGDHVISEAVRETNNNEDNEDNDIWNHINQQMDQEDSYDEFIDGDKSDKSDKSDKGDYIECIPGIPLNNTSDIDEILAGKNIITDNSLSDILNIDSDLTRIDDFINTMKGNKEDNKVISPVYESMTVSQLKKLLSDQNLPVSGNKTKLIMRLNENPF